MNIDALILLGSLIIMNVLMTREWQVFIAVLKETKADLWRQLGAIEPGDKYNPKSIVLSTKLNFFRIAIDKSNGPLAGSAFKIRSLYWGRIFVIGLFILYAGQH